MVAPSPEVSACRSSSKWFGGSVELTEQFTWQGRTIACGKSGTGPAVVFCHGTPFSSLIWSRYADALSSDYTVYLWDMPGYGQSSKHAEHPVDFGSQATAFAALLAHWGLDHPHVIAHDFGGAVSLRATLVDQASYASLMLVDVVAIPPSGSAFFRFVQDNPTTLEGLPPYIHNAVLDAYIQGAAQHKLRDDQMAALRGPWTGEVGQAAFYRQIAQYDESYLVENEAKLGRLTAPVRVLWGAGDSWVPTQTARRLADLIPGAVYAEIADAGHLVQYDAPIALANDIRAWLTAHAGPPANAETRPTIA